MSITAVIDTNVWVSAFLNPEGYPARLMRAGEAGQFDVVIRFLDELEATART